MASNKINLTITVNTDGTVTAAAKNLKKLNAETKKTTKQAKKLGEQSNKTNRNLRGTRESSGSAGKDFARQAQGMGGLVAAYATVAANVFALSSAFLVLRRTADLSSMMKSAEDFSNRFGVSVTRITKQMQEASGGALSFADALPTINKAISSGIGTEKLELLTIAATKASQTFGGSATEALNRFISASQRGRVEIIQTLGIVIKTEQAYADYGAIVGKTALELTAFDRQQAILNATIEASQNVFDGINIDPNPFQQLLTTITDLKDEVGVFITDAITPMLDSFNKSKTAAAALIALLVSMVAKRIFPALGDQLIELQKKSIASTTGAIEALKFAKEKETKSILATGVKQIGLTKKQLLTRSDLFKSYYAKRLKNHKSFSKKLVNQNGKINAGILNEQRSALSTEINARAPGGSGRKLEAFRGIPTQVLENERNRLILLTKETDNAKAATVKLTAAEKARGRGLTELSGKMAVVNAKMKAATTSFKSQLTTGFSKTFASTQSGFILGAKSMGSAWGVFARRAIFQTKGVQVAFEAFGRAVGRTVGFVAGALTRLLSILSSLTLVISLGLFVWQKYGDSIRGITPGMREVMVASESFKEGLDEINVRVAKAIVLFSNSLPNSLKKLRDALKFTGGTFASINTEIINFRTVIVKQLDGLTLDETITKLKNLKAATKDLSSRAQLAIDNPALLDAAVLSRKVFSEKQRLVVLGAKEITQHKENQAAIADLTTKIENYSKVITTDLVRAVIQATDLAERAGFEQIGTTLLEAIERGFKSSDIKLNVFDKLSLVAAAGTGDQAELERVLNNIRSRIEDPTLAAKFSDTIALVIQDFISIGQEATISIDQALGSLEDVDNRINNFVVGLDKARAAAGKNKEISGFILDINRELKELLETQGKNRNSLLASRFTDPKELARVKALLGFQIDSTVTLGLAQEEAQRRELDILAATEARLISGELLKVQAITISSLKAEEVSNDFRRLQILQETLNAELEINRINLTKRMAEQIEQENKLSGLREQANVSAETLSITQAELDTTIASVAALKEKRAILSQDLRVERERFKIYNESLDSLRSTNKLIITQSNIIKSMSTSFATTAKERIRVFGLQKKALIIEEATLEAKIAEFTVDKKTTEQHEKELVVLNAQLEIVKLKTEQLELQRDINKAFTLQDSGNDLSKEGMVTLGRIFNREIKTGVAKLQPTLVTLGKGFADAVNSTVDSAVDKLLEGHGFSGFAHAVQEALKDGLRKAFGDALKNAIKSNIAGLFPKLSPLLKTQAEKDAEAAIKAQIEAAKKAADIEAISQTKTTENSEIVALGTTATTALKDEIVNQITATKELMTTMQECGCGTANTNAPKLATVSTPAKAKASAEESNETLETIAAESGELNTGIKLVAEAVAETGNTTASTFISIGGQLIAALSGGTGGAEAGGGFVNTALGIAGAIFGFGKGGIMQHARPMASGGMVTSPQLALIGEGKTNEAVVPLPNNREIPVDLQGAAGDTINIEQNFDFRNADTGAIPQLRAEARAIEDRTFNRVFSEINKGGKYAKMAGRR